MLLRGVLAAGLAAGLLPLMSGSALAERSVTPPPPVAAAAQRGAGWLAKQLRDAGGRLSGRGGRPDVATTADALLALQAAGVHDERAVATGRAFLRSAYDTDEPRVLAKLILVAVATEDDPRDFADASGDGDDLVARLLATRQDRGDRKGLFGESAPTVDAVVRQGLALTALAAADVRRSEVDDAVGWLLDQQCRDGSWMPFRDDTAEPCPATNPKSPNPQSPNPQPDTNSTAHAVEALRAIGADPAYDPLPWLKSAQARDGGWPIVPGGVSDPNSTAVVVRALIANGTDPAAEEWRPRGRTPYQRLIDFQLPSGAFWYGAGAVGRPGTRKPDLLATVHAVPALAGRALPLTSDTSPAATPNSTPSPPAAGPRPPTAPGNELPRDEGGNPLAWVVVALIVATAGAGLVAWRRRRM